MFRVNYLVVTGIYDRVADLIYKVVSREAKNLNSKNIGDGAIN